jgi:hypothetical protein
MKSVVGSVHKWRFQDVAAAARLSTPPPKAAVGPASSFFTLDSQVFDRIEDNKARFYSQAIDRIENTPTSQAAYEGSPLRWR